jgi:hypothetical protein
VSNRRSDSIEQVHPVPDLIPTYVNAVEACCWRYSNVNVQAIGSADVEEDVFNGCTISCELQAL